MLPGFKEITVDITEEEIHYANVIACNIRQKCIGKENAVTNKRLREAILKVFAVKIHPVRVRKMINYIRAFNLVPCLCASSKGYYQAGEVAEWTSWKLSMQKRINEMQRTLDCASYFNDQQEKL